MSNKNDPIHQFLGLIKQPDPPDSLREQTLSIAVQTMRESAAERDFWTSIWESRPLRLAWAATVVALLAANLILPRFERKQQSESGMGNRLELEELGDAVSAPRLRFYVQPLIGAPSPTLPFHDTKPKTQKEKL